SAVGEENLYVGYLDLERVQEGRLLLQPHQGNRHPRLITLSLRERTENRHLRAVSGLSRNSSRAYLLARSLTYSLTRSVCSVLGQWRCRQAPQANGAVAARGRQEPAVGAERHTAHQRLMPFQNRQTLTGSDIPYSRCAIVTAGGQEPAV